MSCFEMQQIKLFRPHTRQIVAFGKITKNASFTSVATKTEVFGQNGGGVTKIKTQCLSQLLYLGSLTLKKVISIFYNIFLFLVPIF